MAGINDFFTGLFGGGGYSPSNSTAGLGGGDTFTPSMSGVDPNWGGSGNFVPSTWSGSGGTWDGSGSSDSSGGGGMNWAGLSSGLKNLSDKLGGGQSSGSNTLSDSKSVSSTVSGGTLSPAGAGRGAEALASMLANRNQLAQALMLAAMQGKGRGKSGGGLLG
jgi:general secretion pathway protein D